MQAPVCDLYFQSWINYEELVSLEVAGGCMAPRGSSQSLSLSLEGLWRGSRELPFVVNWNEGLYSETLGM